MLTIEQLAIAKANGFFRAKKAERKAEIAEAIGVDLAALTEYEAAEQRKKEARIAAKMEQEASKPLTGGIDCVTETFDNRPSGAYVLTCAQNNTDVDVDFLASLKQFCDHTGATLLIARTTYNKSGFQQPGVDDGELWYADEVKPFLVKGTINLDGKFHFIADANVIVTAKNPVNGFEGITPAGIHAIIPASKIALKTVARLKNSPAKVITSTGVVTKRNYILRKAGAVAAYEHNIGAIFIDTDTGEMRHLEQMPGSAGFYDAGFYYGPSGITSGHCAAALQFGDIHAEKAEEENIAYALDLISEYSPERVILHDLMDFASRNHHNVKDCLFMAEQHEKGNTVKKDIAIVGKLLQRFASEVSAYGGGIDVVESNHDLAIDTWLKNADFKLDPANAVTYLELMLAKYKAIAKGIDLNTLAYALRNYSGLDCVNFHRVDESLMIAGVEMGCHGHTGINGARGNPAGYRVLGIAMNTGHTHSPSIHGPVWTAGVLGSLEMGYNIGASSWMIASIVTWPNGQRQIIFK
jgi:hypothetical protein